MYRGRTILIWTLTAILGLCVPSAWSGSGEDKNALTLPYVAVGGAPDGWHLLTLLFLTNTGSDADSGTIEFFDNDGQPLPVALNGDSELKAEATWDIPVGASKLLVLTHPSEFLLAGWLQINLSQKSGLHVTTIVRFYNSRSLIAEAGVQAGPKHSALSSSYYKTASAQQAPYGYTRGIKINNALRFPNSRHQ